MNSTCLRVLVVDDVALARQRLERLLRTWPDVELAGSCADAEGALDAVERIAPDVLLLDIDMPECDGFAFLQRLPAARPAVIFVTAHARHAVRAFRVDALDYLLKPVAADDLRDALDRVWARRDVGEADACLLLRERDAIRRLPADSIDWIEAAGNYVCIRAAGETHVHRETLTRLQARLDPARFQRIHRSRIVNLSRIERLVPLWNGDHTVVLRDGSELGLSRTFRDALFARLGEMHG